MTELPNVTRNWTNFNKMLPGVTQAGTDGAAAQRHHAGLCQLPGGRRLGHPFS